MKNVQIVFNSVRFLFILVKEIRNSKPKIRCSQKSLQFRVTNIFKYIFDYFQAVTTTGDFVDTKLLSKY